MKIPRIELYSFPQITKQVNRIINQLECLNSRFCDFCAAVNTCLGISDDGDPTLFLNQQGVWATPGGGGGGSLTISEDGSSIVTNTTEIDFTGDNISVVDSGGGVATITVGSPVPIEVTLAQFQALEAANNLQYPDLYVITDIQNGLAIESISASSYNPLGTLQMYIPDYTITGVYKGQLEATDTVTIADRWVWGNKVWQSITGVNSPAIDAYTLDPTDWTELSPSVANGYILYKFIAEFDSVGGVVTSLKQPIEQNISTVPTALIPLLGLDAIQANQWANDSLQYYNNIATGSSNNRIIDSFIFMNQNVKLTENDLQGGSSISNNSGDSGGGEFFQNVLTGNAQMTQNTLVSNSLYELNTLSDGTKIQTMSSHNSEITGCILSGDSNNDIGYGHQRDASAVRDCSMTGVMCKIEAFLQNNNSLIENINFSGEVNTLTGLSQLLLDNITNISASGDAFFMGGITQNGYSVIDNITSSLNNVNITNISQNRGTIQNVNYIANGGMNNVTVNNAILENITNIALENVYVDGHDIDFTGFGSNISNLEIRGNKGTFTYTVDFSITPLTAGNSIRFGFIPNGAVVTSLFYITNGLAGGIGASLSLGIETDDVNYGFPATAVTTLVNTPKLTFSNPTTANRPMILSATVGDVTSGTLSITVEFSSL